MNVLRSTTLLLVWSMLAASAFAGSMPMRNTKGFLIDPAGRTLYSYDPDGTAGVSRCEGPCAAVWPPYVVDPGTQPAGDYGVALRAGGARQWVYLGRPLYLFAGDAKPGDHDGDGVNGTWHMVH